MSFESRVREVRLVGPAALPVSGGARATTVSGQWARGAATTQRSFPSTAAAARARDESRSDESPCLRSLRIGCVGHSHPLQRGSGCPVRSKGVRKAQHPFPHRPRAEHLVHPMARRLGHAPRAAAGAESALLAGERHQPLRMAVLAHYAQEPCSSTPQRRYSSNSSVLRIDAREEIRVVRLDKRVQRHSLGCVAGIACCGLGARR